MYMYAYVYKCMSRLFIETDSDIVGLRSKRCGFEPWVTKILWSRKWQPTPVFLPGKFHGQGSLEGYSPWGHKELDTTEQLNTNTHLTFREDDSLT